MKYLVLLASAMGLSATAQTTYDIAVSDSGFAPDSLVIQAGDSVRVTFFALDHSFRQVSEETWLADSSTISGLEIGPPAFVGESQTFALLTADTFYYVCAFHVEVNGEKGFIVVEPATGMNEPSTAPTLSIAPNPANEGVNVRMPDGLHATTAEVYDARGSLVFSAPLDDGWLNLRHLDAGCYSLACVEGGKRQVARQRLVVVH
ncbi:MAG: hypothetical protein ABI599_11465 [Flavobacteriales bacterium]